MEIDQVVQKRWNNSLRNSIVGHLLLLLLMLFFKLHTDPDKTIETQYAVAVSFQAVEFTSSKSSNSTASQAAAGAQREKSEAPAKLETAKPSPVEVPKPTAQTKPQPTQPKTAPQPTEPVISETTVEESDIQAIEEPIEVEDPEPEYIPQTAPSPQPTEEVVIKDPDLPSLADIIGTINDDPIETEEAKVPAKTEGTGSKNSTSNGTSNNDPSLKDGSSDGSGKSTSGEGKGKDKAGDDNDSGIGTGGAGEGEFDASGDGIFGRKVIYMDPDMRRLVAEKSGKIVFKVCISRRGHVSTLEIDQVRTTIKDRTILKNALESMYKYKFEPDYTASAEQCGVFTVIVDNYKGIRPR